MLTNTIIYKRFYQKRAVLKYKIQTALYLFISQVYTNLISAISTANSCKDFSIFSIVVFEGFRLPVT